MPAFVLTKRRSPTSSGWGQFEAIIITVVFVVITFIIDHRHFGSNKRRKPARVDMAAAMHYNMYIDTSAAAYPGWTRRKVVVHDDFIHVHFSTQHGEDAWTRYWAYGEVAKSIGLKPKDVKSAVLGIFRLAAEQMKKSGTFNIADMLYLKLHVRPATKARRGRNPKTKKPCVFKAKPASKMVTAIPMKKFKEMVNTGAGKPASKK